MNNINGFTFYKSYYECLVDLEQKDKEQILYAILEYVFEDKEPNFDGFKKTIWVLIKPNLTTSKNKSNNAQKSEEEKQNQIKPKSNHKQKENISNHSPQEEDKEEEDDKDKEEDIDKNKDYIIISKYMFEKIKKLNPNNKEPNFKTWADDFRKMIEIDKRNPKDIPKLINWVYLDDFWKCNILSPKKLREKYDQLMIKARNSNNFKTVEDIKEKVEEMAKFI